MVDMLVTPVKAYLKGLRKSIAVTVPVFIAFIVVGAMLPRPFQEVLTESLGRQFAPMVSLPPLMVMVIIFLNNALKSFVAMLLGVFFGIAPIAFVAVNGLIIGLVVSVFTQAQGPSPPSPPCCPTAS